MIETTKWWCIEGSIPISVAGDEYINGPIPTEIGWYQTAIKGQTLRKHQYRWWNGQYWSYPAMADSEMDVVVDAASKQSAWLFEMVLWRHINV